MTEYLDLEDLLNISAKIQRTHPPAVRDYGLLESAAARPQTSIFGEDAYPTFHEKAGALLHSLARNHALLDGNKRLAWVATRAMYRINRSDMKAPNVDEGEAFVLMIARGELEVPQIAKTLQRWSA